MKKHIILVIGLLLVCLFAISFAKESWMTKNMAGQENKIIAVAGQETMPGEQMMGMCCPMHRIMMGGMCSRAIVAAADGSIIVMCCDKLIKYDKDLNLVKEVQIPVDTEAMQKNMTKMMENCPMCKGMMQRKGIMMEKDPTK